MPIPWPRLCILLPAWLVQACILAPPGGDSTAGGTIGPVDSGVSSSHGGDDGADSSDGPPQTQDEDIAEYEALAVELQSHRTDFLGKEADEIQAIGSRLMWLEFPGFDPVLRSADAATGTEVPYTFSVGAGDAYNYRAGENAVMTAIEDSGDVRYQLYAIDEPDTLLAEVVMEAPKDEQRWFAYAVEGSTGYILETGEVNALLRFGPGEPLTQVLTLEEAGAAIGIFWEFGVENGTMVFVESGRIWSLDLDAKSAVWLGNEQELSGKVNFDLDGAMFGAANGLFYFDFATGDLVDVDLLIEQNEYEMNTTFAATHLHTGGDWTRRGQLVVYQGSSGIFAYDIAADVVTPVLLDPRLEPPMRLTYRNPQLLDTGVLFVQGLFSENGAIGAEGPIYRVDAEFLAP